MIRIEGGVITQVKQFRSVQDPSQSLSSISVSTD